MESYKINLHLKLNEKQEFVLLLAAAALRENSFIFNRSQTLFAFQHSFAKLFDFSLLVSVVTVASTEWHSRTKGKYTE